MVNEAIHPLFASSDNCNKETQKYIGTFLIIVWAYIVNIAIYCLGLYSECCLLCSEQPLSLFHVLCVPLPASVGFATPLAFQTLLLQIALKLIKLLLPHGANS